MSQVPGGDPAFTETVNQNMLVPEHLSVGSRPQSWEEEGENAMRGQKEPPTVYTMQVPERLTYTEAPDMSPRPLFATNKPNICGPLDLEPCWESPCGDVFYKEALQSPIRRSYSDQSFGRTPPGTPNQLKKALAVPRHPSGSRRSSSHLHQKSNAPLSVQTIDPQAPPQPQPLLSTPINLLSPWSILQVAKQLGLQASQRLLQTVSQEHRAVESWCPEEEGGAAVEFMILRRQVIKMSRRLAALERHNAERRNTEFVLFSMLFSACLLNSWLWIRR